MTKKKLTDKEFDEHYLKFQGMIRKDVGVIAMNFPIDEYIEEVKDELESLRESKKDGKTHVVKINFRTGITMRLDGDERLAEAFERIEKEFEVKK